MNLRALGVLLLLLAFSTLLLCAQQETPAPKPRLSLRALPQYPVAVVGPDSLVAFDAGGRVLSRLRVAPRMANMLTWSNVPLRILGAPLGGAPLGGGDCYTIRSYKFERYNGGDATRQVGESTCTPASKLRVMPAIPKPR